MVMAISASASIANAPNPLLTESAPRKTDASANVHAMNMHPPGVIVDFSEEGIQLSASVAVSKAQEALAIMDVNLDGELSLDGFVTVAPSG